MKNIGNFHEYTINQELQSQLGSWVQTKKNKRVINYKLSVHYHPYVDELIQLLNKKGLNSLFDVNKLASLKANLSDHYVAQKNVLKPIDYTNGTVKKTFAQENIDVSDDGAYSIYNWELFFHAPLAIACHLSSNQKFEEAQRWFHYIFDPTSNDYTVDSPQRFWKFLRFRQETSPEFIQEMMKKLSAPEDSELKTRIEKSIQAWRDKPFQPHVIARGRYLAYQLNVLMKYLDNLIAWGDSLFRQNTIESINEATQIYVLASNILGLRPEKIPPRGKVKPKSYAELKAMGIDAFGNTFAEMENDFPFNTVSTSSINANQGSNSVFGITRSLYFCIPQNDKLLGYWDTVEDRLYKIRHCMNIEGIVQKLALFDPPIDPGMLVKAAAAGLDIASIVNNINQPLSVVRGPLLLQKAMEICNELKSLGNSLLSSIEKGEAEHLAVLRQKHELNLQNLVRDVRFLQWKESESSTEALVKSRNTAFERYKHYKKILGSQDSDIDPLKKLDLDRNNLNEESFDGIYTEWVGKYAADITNEPYRVEDSVGGLMEFAGNVVTDIFGGQLGKTLPLNKNENAELNIFLPTSDTFNKIAMGIQVAAAGLKLIPKTALHGTPLGVGGKLEIGGDQFGDSVKEATNAVKAVANAFAGSAERASKMAGYYRRAEEYVLQSNLAASELVQYGRQMVCSLIREQMAKKEYENHLKQIEQSQEVYDFMTNKFTQEDLYSWMKSTISKTYFDTYKFAYDTAKAAEETMKYELMRKEFDNLNIIQFGYWDSTRKGLLAGETLYLDLKRLEMAYLKQNARDYEMVKHVSLRKLDPIGLLKLKATGSCEIKIPEWVFDMDSPGQYMRRIKTVALSIPCITGPYTGVHCKLSLVKSSIRTSNLLKDDEYARKLSEDDDRFRDFTGTIQSIVTSTGQNDTGMFETNLKDERFLPFEGAGVESTWRLELPNDIPQFDFESISDVVLHIRYTAREAGLLKAKAVEYIKENVLEASNLVQLFCLNYDFSTAWYRFESATKDDDRLLNISLNKDMFPYWVNKLGMDDVINLTFCCIDWTKNKLNIGTQIVPLTLDSSKNWTLSVNKDSTVFPFLKNNKDKKVYMAVTFARNS
ncbi:MAG: hypothetical protein J7604_23900 [Sporocytophaga sp.]|uniref:Tc toxin subunit A-related protein n=1 Tax=Sporocytophaga sp. TaxID=2231183 RepID=UPI001B00ECA7|nr:hypothetical protein [Sporocytophaga sp.]MBO9703279.1 hypothetical protein [Sporocytophaga sp.]